MPSRLSICRRTLPDRLLGRLASADQFQAVLALGRQDRARMHEAAAGVKAADKELATLGAELPKVRPPPSRAAIRSWRRRGRLWPPFSSIAHSIEPLIKSLPETAAQLADDLPKLSKELSATLRETQKLKEVAVGLRATQGQLDKSVAAWPEARKTLLSAVEGLKVNRDRLDRAIGQQTQHQVGVEAGVAGGIAGDQPHWLHDAWAIRWK